MIIRSGRVNPIHHPLIHLSAAIFGEGARSLHLDRFAVMKFINAIRRRSLHDSDAKIYAHFWFIKPGLKLEVRPDLTPARLGEQFAQ